MKSYWKILMAVALASTILMILVASLAVNRSWAGPADGDAYEPDDTCEQARPISTTGAAQHHTFHQYTDTDWISFTAFARQTYWVRAIGRTSPEVASLTLYSTCSPISSTALLSPSAFLRWTAPSSSTYYVQAAVSSPEMYDPGAEYDLSVAVERRSYLPSAMYRASMSGTNFALPQGLSTVEKLYPVSETARRRLRRQGFVILDSVQEERLSRAYTTIADREDVAVFVTSDAMLYLFHNVLDDLLTTVEKHALYTETLTLVRELQADSETIYATMPVTQSLGREAARHNLVVLSVARKLLEPEFAPPSEVLTDVLTYTRKISEHTVVETYPGDDYTQYEPRGHYAGDPQLERYFRAMKWLGRRIYRIEDNIYLHDADVELTAAVQLAQMLQENPAAQAAWQRLYDVTRLLVGPADSITPPMVSTAVSRTFGVSFTLKLLEDEDNLGLLRGELMTNDDYPTSEIIPVPTLPGQMPRKYIQVMGERYLPDGEVMQKTVYTYTSRTLPSGLDVMATVLASDRADALLAEEKAQDPAFAEQLTTLRAQFAGYTTTWWTRSTYNNWLYSLKPLLVSYGDEYPRFMRSAMWERKQLHTALASWSHLRHDFILYGKQSYPPFGGSSGYGFVEPVPEFYTRLGDACRQISDTLSLYDMLPEPHARVLGRLAERLDRFAGYADKIVAGQSLSAEEQNDINAFGHWLERLFSDDVGEKTPITVADVASDPNTGRVLHEGVGAFNPIVVIYELPDGTPMVGLGHVLSYYEFTQPDWERMTDAEWRSQVISGTPPARPWWVVDLMDALETQ